MLELIFFGFKSYEFCHHDCPICLFVVFHTNFAFFCVLQIQIEGNLPGKNENYSCSDFQKYFLVLFCFQFIQLHQIYFLFLSINKYRWWWKCMLAFWIFNLNKKRWNECFSFSFCFWKMKKFLFYLDSRTLHTHITHI